MIRKTGELNPYLETDKEEYKELVELYNAWMADTAFLSNLNWIDTNLNWKKMHEYCTAKPNILIDFWIDMYRTFGEVGHFTFMLFQVFPDIIELPKHCPIKEMEKLLINHLTK